LIQVNIQLIRIHIFVAPSQLGLCHT